MKKIIFLGILLCLTLTSYAQINIPDPVFKQALLASSINTNNDSTISEQEAQNTINITIDGSSGTNKISNLTGIEKFINLQKLIIPHHNLTSIDLSKNTKLKELNLNNNNLTSLDVRNCSLEKLVFLNNQYIKTALLTGQNFGMVKLGNHYYGDFTKVHYENCPNLQFVCVDQPYVQSAQDRAAGHNIHPNYRVSSNCSLAPTCEIINFPDPNFKQALLAQSPAIDTDGDGEICVDEAKKVTHLNIENKNITDITGIEYLINLEVLNASFNKLTSADFSKNSKLNHLNIDNNQLININLKNNPSLHYLTIGFNQLTQIDLSKNKKLTTLFIGNNKLSQLDLSDNINLHTLVAVDNVLTSLNINNCSSLVVIQIWNNQINHLDISTNSDLESIQIQNNRLTELEITTNNAKLSQLDLSNNLINKIDVRNCTSIKSLNVSNNPNLTEAYLTGNHEFYQSYEHFHTIVNNINHLNLRNCYKLNFVCVNPVSFLNDIRNYIKFTLGYLNCTVSDDCTPTTTSAFDNHFVLSPNPASNYLVITPKDPLTSGNAAVTILRLSGEIVKKIVVKFAVDPREELIREDPFGTPSPRTPNNMLIGPNSVLIDVTGLPVGQYILHLQSSKGLLTTKFIKK
ncbi:leucine-rich repeat domain-containing protein [Aquimarina macrocephali]|uniref:leucine-rich repeat domain-containing protein n=1 Tax=Aquimarina macrocephali TaxID=666563 RepID=UPI003F66EE28